MTMCSVCNWQLHMLMQLALPCHSLATWEVSLES